MDKRRSQVHTYTWATVWDLIRVDTYSVIISYIIVAVYCLVCLRGVGETGDCSAVIQLFADSIAPTTITLALTSLIQCYYERKREDQKSWFVVSLLGVVVFTILASGFHPITDGMGLIAVITGSIILVLLGLCLVFETKIASHVGLGISGRED